MGEAHSLVRGADRRGLLMTMLLISGSRGVSSVVHIIYDFDKWFVCKKFAEPLLRH